MTEEMEKNPDVTFTEIDYETFVGSGYLAGPLLGYQTDDGKWSFSLAPMIMSSFKQDVHGTALVPKAYGQTLDLPFEMNDKTTVNVSRIDFDFAASFSLADYDNLFTFLKYVKLFAGVKSQKIEYEFEYYTRILSMVDTGTIEMDYEVLIPTVGAGVFFPFTNTIVAGVQGGIGMA